MGRDENEVTCNAGHVHKNTRSADACEQRRTERSEVVEFREQEQVKLIAPEFAEHGGAYFVSRRKKAWRNR